MPNIAWRIPLRSESGMMIIHKYEFFDVSWVKDPADKSAVFRLTLWQRLVLWAHRMLKVR